MKSQCVAAKWVYTLYLATVVVTAGHNIEDCEIRFQDNGACACDNVEPVTRYSDRSIKIQPCYCMYYDPTLNLSVVGHCYFSCYEFSGTVAEINSSAEFNADICSKYGKWRMRNASSEDGRRYINRIGRFCGECDNSYGIGVYSYQLWSCIPCQDYSYTNWLRYFAVAFLPLTVFYILAVLLSFNVTSSSLNGPVLVIQCVLSPIQITMARSSPFTNLKFISVLKAATSVFGMVNLDFFRLAYPPFCLHPRANIFQILSLDYLVALYPFLLIFMTYVLVTAHDKQYRLVVWMWRPVHRCVHRHRKTWNIRTSLIEIFASFILFSYVKILGVSIQILAFTATYDVAGNRLEHYYTYYDGTVEYFGPAHLPYALLAISISSVFVVLPFLLLAVYPCRCFHKCLNCCGLRSQALHIIMDAFQGSYKTHPRDLRYFSAFYLLLRILMLVQFQIFTSTLMLFTSGILSLISAAIVFVFKPYKVKSHNTVDSVLLLLMGTYFISYHAQLFTNYSEQNLTVVVQRLSIVMLLLYFFSLVLWKLLGAKLQAAVGKAKMAWRYIVHRHREHGIGDGIESFQRSIDAREDTAYAPLLGEPQQPTY